MVHLFNRLILFLVPKAKMRSGSSTSESKAKNCFLHSSVQSLWLHICNNVGTYNLPDILYLHWFLAPYCTSHIVVEHAACPFSRSPLTHFHFCPIFSMLKPNFGKNWDDNSNFPGNFKLLYFFTKSKAINCRIKIETIGLLFVEYAFYIVSAQFISFLFFETEFYFWKMFVWFS